MATLSWSTIKLFRVIIFLTLLDNFSRAHVHTSAQVDCARAYVRTGDCSPNIEIRFIIHFIEHT